MADKKHRIHRKKSVASMAPPEIPFSRHHEPALQRRGVAPRESERNLELDATRVILDRYAPPGVVVDADLQIVQFRGQTGPYLEPAPGEASLGLLKMAREGLLHGLRSALQTARKSGQAVRRDSVEVRINGEWRPVAIDVLPLTVQDRRYYLVLFDDSVAAQPPSPKPAAKRPATHKTAPKTDLLQRELAASRDYLQSIIQELEAANEELQSTNEELDTAKEELQSTNEELNTVNEELQGRNDEISRANSDLVNLLGSVHIAIVIVGSDLRIRRFTPMAEKILNLIPGDVNRQIGHINPNIECPDLEQLIIDSIDSMNPIERDVRDKQGKWYSLRIRPYKNASNRIEGAVLALFDIDQLIRSQHRTQLALDLAGAIVGSAPVPSALLDRDLRVRIANESFAAIFGLAAPEVPGRTLTELGGKMWNITEWKQGLPSSRISLNAIVVDDSRERHWTLRGTVVKAHDEADGSMIMVVASEQL